MGAVYAAEGPSEGRARQQVALKLLYPAVAKDPELLEFFLNEGKLSNVVGKGAVRALEYGEAPQGHYLVMEMLRGKSMADVQKTEKKVAPRKVVKVLDDTLRTLARAHRKGVVHRDIKPDNIFLTRAGETVLLDFGAGAQRGKPSLPRGDFYGSPGLASPEQAAGDWGRVDAKSDLWSLAGTTKMLLTNEAAPFDVEAAKRGHPYPVCSARPSEGIENISPRLAGVIDRAMVCDRNKRFSSASEMHKALTKAPEHKPHAIMATATRPALKATTTQHSAVPEVLSAIAVIGGGTLLLSALFGGK